MNQEERLQHVINASQVMDEGLEVAQSSHDKNDSLTILKTSYLLATKEIADHLKRSQRFYFIKMDDYIDYLYRQRCLNLYGKRSKAKDRILRKRQNDLIEFQKYCLLHSHLYQDDIVILSKDYQIIKPTLDQFTNYVMPYQMFLQKEFKRLRPNINI